MIEHTPESEAMQERRWYYHSFRQAFGRAGSAYGLARSPDNRWFLDVLLPDGTKRRLFMVPDFEAGLRSQDYCSKHDTLVKIALIEADTKGDLDHLEQLLVDSIEFGEMPKRRLVLSMEVEVFMRGTDEEIKSHMLLAIRSNSGVSAAKINFIDGPRIEEPRPRRED